MLNGNWAKILEKKNTVFIHGSKQNFYPLLRKKRSQLVMEMVIQGYKESWEFK
jgi:hypothetical protein